MHLTSTHFASKFSLYYIDDISVLQKCNKWLSNGKGQPLKSITNMQLSWEARKQVTSQVNIQSYIKKLKRDLEISNYDIITLSFTSRHLIV